MGTDSRHHLLRTLLIAGLAAGACGRIGYAPLGDDDGGAGLDADPAAPRVTQTLINGGAITAHAPTLAVTVAAAGGTAPLSVRFAPPSAGGDCQAAYQDDGWRTYADPAATFDRVVLPVDGTIKLCAWAKDATGRVSVISPATGTEGVDAASIAYQGENIPRVEQFTVTNLSGGRTYAAGETVSISWTITDVEGLAEGPVDLWYTTSPPSAEDWIPITQGFGAVPASQTSWSGSYGSFTAPAEPFRVRIVAADAAGNRSVPVLSDAQNTPGWSVHAGSSDHGLGSSGLAAGFDFRNNGTRRLALDPRTGDLFVVAPQLGLLRMDGRTGLVERLMRHGTGNLPDDGPLPEDAAFEEPAQIRFGPDGLLYLAPNGGDARRATSTILYQIDLAGRHVRRYLGGGTANDASATPTTVFFLQSVFAFDEDGAVYFTTSCTPGSWTSGVSATRLLKAARNPDGTAGAISVVAGDCAQPPAAPADPGPSDALASPLGLISYPGLGTLAVWDHGRTVYYSFYHSGTWKILDGQLYASDVDGGPAGTIAYDPANGLLYSLADELLEWAPNLTGAGDTLVRTVAAGDGTGADCSHDGILATAACVSADFSLDFGPDGTPLFIDGSTLNGTGVGRVRFVDATGRMRTWAGRHPFVGAGLDRRVLLAHPAGIYHKPASAPNQAAFPAGLYFVDPMALVLAHVDPATDRVTVDWGNGSGEDAPTETGVPVGPDVSLGESYSGGNVMAFTVDDDGLPWLRCGTGSRARLVRLDASRRVVALQSELGSAWELAPDGASPADYHIWPYGGWHNLTLKGQAAFLLGGYSDVTDHGTIKIFDFAADLVTRLMGQSPDGFTEAPPGGVPAAAASLSSSCRDPGGGCNTVYQPAGDRLYFSEDQHLRYIAPVDATVGTPLLHDEWVATTEVYNFVFRPDGSQIFYLTGGGNLRCHDLTSGSAFCDDSELGPPAVLDAIEDGPNQLTWLDAGTLLISNYRGEIYAYTLAAD